MRRASRLIKRIPGGLLDCTKDALLRKASADFVYGIELDSH